MATQTIQINKGEEVQGQYVDLTEKKTVYATDKAPFHKEGEEIVTHPEMAKVFISKGIATEKKKGAKE